MPEANTTKSLGEKGSTSIASRRRERSHEPTPGGLTGEILNLQRSAGNRAVSQLLLASTGTSSQQDNPSTPSTVTGWSGQPAEGESRADLLSRAHEESGARLDESVRVPMERDLGVGLSGVRVHSGDSSRAAAESLGARAYTIGSDIYLGRDAQHLNALQRSRLLAHEAVHTIQQGGRPLVLQGKMEVSQPDDGAEVEAERIADVVISGDVTAQSSQALALRNALRVTPVIPSVQRDILGDKTWPQGKLEISFKKNDAKVKGAYAREVGDVTFRPSATSPDTTSIRFIQIVRTFDTSTGKEYDWTGSVEANRNKMQTTASASPTVAPGFYVDQNAASLAKRTKKTDPTVEPYYDVTGPPVAGNQTGKKKGKAIDSAVLHDDPGFSGPLKYSFVTSAKDTDAGVYCGTVLWGFETFLDKAGIAKIKGEYKSFRMTQGATTDKAVKLFNEFYQNPGTTGAPK